MHCKVLTSPQLQATQHRYHSVSSLFLVSLTHARTYTLSGIYFALVFNLLYTA